MKIWKKKRKKSYTTHNRSFQTKDLDHYCSKYEEEVTEPKRFKSHPEWQIGVDQLLHHRRLLHDNPTCYKEEIKQYLQDIIQEEFSCLWCKVATSVPSLERLQTRIRGQYFSGQAWVNYLKSWFKTVDWYCFLFAIDLQCEDFLISSNHFGGPFVWWLQWVFYRVFSDKDLSACFEFHKDKFLLGMGLPSCAGETWFILSRSRCTKPDGSMHGPGGEPGISVGSLSFMSYKGSAAEHFPSCL